MWRPLSPFLLTLVLSFRLKFLLDFFVVLGLFLMIPVLLLWLLFYHLLVLLCYIMALGVFLMILARMQCHLLLGCSLLILTMLLSLQWLRKAFASGDSLQRHLFNEFLHMLIDCNVCLQPPNNEKLISAIKELDTKELQFRRSVLGG
eukprot:s1726_g2.t1